jgi:hypothetical protein
MNEGDEDAIRILESKMKLKSWSIIEQARVVRTKARKRKAVEKRSANYRTTRSKKKMRKMAMVNSASNSNKEVNYKGPNISEAFNLDLNSAIPGVHNKIPKKRVIKNMKPPKCLLCLKLHHPEDSEGCFMLPISNNLTQVKKPTLYSGTEAEQGLGHMFEIGFDNIN